jgi:hypothetical protein
MLLNINLEILYVFLINEDSKTMNILSMYVYEHTHTCTLIRVIACLLLIRF